MIRRRAAVDEMRASIWHPTLIEAYDHDCFYPLAISADDLRGKALSSAVANGWSEWIETGLDIKAVRQGYVYDLSRDHKGKPIYWHAMEWHGELRRCWWRYRRGRLVPIEDAEEVQHGERWHVGGGDFICRFIETTLRHTKGDKVGQLIQLVPVHRKNLSTVFGWINRETGLRRYVSSYWEMGKKQAKTTTVAGVILFLLLADGYVEPTSGKFRRETRSEVYGAARDMNQARVAFDEAKEFVKSNDTLADMMEVIDSRCRITYPETASYYQVLSMDSASADGKDAHGVILDELHAHRNRTMFKFTERAGRSRRQPIHMSITTAGENTASIWWEERQRARRVIDGTSREFRHHAAIFSGEPFEVTLTESVPAGSTILPVARLLHPVAEGQILRFGAGAIGENEDEQDDGEPPAMDGDEGRVEVVVVERAKRFQPFLRVAPLPVSLEQYSTSVANDDWTSDHAISAANPSVGWTCLMETLQLDRDKALDDPTKAPDYKRFTLSMLSESSTNWINMLAWNRCAGLEHDWRKLIGKPCFGGLDVAISQDLMAFWLAFPSWPIGTHPRADQSPRVTLLGLCWLPGDGIIEREIREDVQYRHLSQRTNFGDFGFCRIHPGSVVNHAAAAEDVLAMRELFKIQAVAFDPAYASFIVDPYLMPAGLPCITHRQGAVSMGPPTAWFDRFVKQTQLAHGGHPLLDVAANQAKLHTRDKAGNTYPAKGKSVGRIDPIVAAVMAVGFCCSPPQVMQSSGAWSGAPGAGMWG